MNHRNGNHGSSFSKQRLGQKRKPWHVEATIKELHKKMKDSVGEWLDAYFKIHAPITVFAHILDRNPLGLDWLKEEGYHHDHRMIRHISDNSFAMVFHLYKKDIIVNTFEFIVNHDGGFKDPHKIGAM